MKQAASSAVLKNATLTYSLVIYITDMSNRPSKTLKDLMTPEKAKKVGLCLDVRIHIYI